MSLATLIMAKETWHPSYRGTTSLPTHLKILHGTERSRQASWAGGGKQYYRNSGEEDCAACFADNSPPGSLLPSESRIELSTTSTSLPSTITRRGLWFLCMFQVSKTAMLLQGNPVSLPLRASAGSLYSSVRKGVSRSAAAVGLMVRPEDGQVSVTRGS